jgi:cytochrome P450
MVSEGEIWKTQRRLIQPAFHRKAISALYEIAATSNAALLRRWEQAASGRATVNVTRDISLMVLEVVLISIFGADYEKVAPYFSVLSQEPARNLEFAQVFRSLGKVILEVAARRRRDGITSTDIIGVLLEARDQNSGQVMPDRQLVNEIKTLIVAGHETTASTLNWIWYLLSSHPEVEDKLSSELTTLLGDRSLDFDQLPKFAYARRIIDEALRLYPPGWLLTRKALKDDQLGDYFVPAGTEIYISPFFIQRHPSLWQDPNCFNPDRFDLDHSPDRHALSMLAFSAGPRNCIGEAFARVEMQIHLITIAARMRLRFVETGPLELDAGVNLRSKHEFLMTPELKPLAECRLRVQELTGQPLAGKCD